MIGNVQGLELHRPRSTGLWERSAHWAAPLLTAALVGLAALFMYDSCGAPLI